MKKKKKVYFFYQFAIAGMGRGKLFDLERALELALFKVGIYSCRQFMTLDADEYERYRAEAERNIEIIDETKVEELIALLEQLKRD